MEINSSSSVLIIACPVWLLFVQSFYSLQLSRFGPHVELKLIRAELSLQLTPAAPVHAHLQVVTRIEEVESEHILEAPDETGGACRTFIGVSLEFDAPQLFLGESIEGQAQVAQGVGKGAAEGKGGRYIEGRG